ncbi:HD domain-containing protein [Aliirhizobium smilacinae]|nr:HD domain-containing protein [Rhizobium smilacinae]
MLQAIEELQRRWRENGILQATENALSEIGFDDVYVDDCLNRPQDHRAKVVKDGIWGMIEIDAASLRLLDCPIVQRLRGIHQLGFSYLTYPSAEHSRFAHSLGMFGVVSRFLNEIRKRDISGSSPGDPYSDWMPTVEQKAIAEHAAILHDIGHMPFSHVTEQILHAHATEFFCGPISVDDFLIDAEDLVGKSKLAELISIAIVLTARFGRFYENYISPQKNSLNPLRIAALIAGKAAEPELNGLANLISGASIDADKIDYINRDAAACGIAVGVDVSRLFLRSRFLSVKPKELQRLRSQPTTPSDEEVIFVVNTSGLDSIEEIGQARSTLYHRVYLHQTTRNAERVLGKALQSYDVTSQDFTNALNLWTSDDFGLLKAVANSQNEGASHLAKRLRGRQLPKRANAFGRRFVSLNTPVKDIFPSMDDRSRRVLSKQIVGTSLEQLRSNTLVGKRQLDFEEKIASEAVRLSELLRSRGYNEYPEGRPLVSVLPMPNIEENREDCIVLDGDQLNLTSFSSVSDEQMEAADIMKSTGYVLCDYPWRNLVFLASRAAFYEVSSEEHDITLEPYPGQSLTVKATSRVILSSDAVSQRIRMTREDLRITLKRADEVGYFDSAPRLSPLSFPGSDLDQAASHLSNFKGQGNWSVTPNSVGAFISQFPPRFRKEVLGLISSFSMFGRSELAGSISNGVGSITLGGKRGFITALSPDSGNAVRTIVEHELSAGLKERGWEFKKGIRDIFGEAQPGDHIVLCDDNVTSGSQAICQFLAWLGVPKEKWTEEQRLERGIESAKLDDRDIELLRELKLTIVVTSGSKAAEENIRNALTLLGFDFFLGIHFQRTIGDHPVDVSSNLRLFLEDVGANVLAWCRHQSKDLSALDDAEREKCKNDSFGYHGAGALMCSPLNVAVGTITAFWAPGYYNGAPWVPLLLRRGYLNHLVLT